MKKYEWYVEKATKAIKRIMTSVDSPFGQAKVPAVEFIKYMKTDHANYIKDLSELCGSDLTDIELENTIFPSQYRWLVRDVALKAQLEYIENIENRIQDFKGKEDNLRVILSMYLLRMAIINALVEAVMAKACELVQMGIEANDISLADIGMGKRVLKYLDGFEDFDSKSIDDWLAITVDPSTFKYFTSATKRILTILMFNK